MAAEGDCGGLVLAQIELPVGAEVPHVVRAEVDGRRMPLGGSSGATSSPIASREFQPNSERRAARIVPVVVHAEEHEGERNGREQCHATRASRPRPTRRADGARPRPRSASEWQQLQLAIDGGRLRDPRGMPPAAPTRSRRRQQEPVDNGPPPRGQGRFIPAGTSATKRHGTPRRGASNRRRWRSHQGEAGTLKEADQDRGDAPDSKAVRHIVAHTTLQGAPFGHGAATAPVPARTGSGSRRINIGVEHEPDLPGRAATQSRPRPRARIATDAPPRMPITTKRHDEAAVKLRRSTRCSCRLLTPRELVAANSNHGRLRSRNTSRQQVATRARTHRQESHCYPAGP